MENEIKIGNRRLRYPTLGSSDTFKGPLEPILEEYTEKGWIPVMPKNNLLQELKNKLKEMSGYWEEFICRPAEFSSEGQVIELGYKFSIDNKWYGSYFQSTVDEISEKTISKVIKLSEIVRNNRNEHELTSSVPNPININLL